MAIRQRPRERGRYVGINPPKTAVSTPAWSSVTRGDSAVTSDDDRGSMRKAILVLALLAASVTASGQAVTIDPELALPIERIFERMETEIVFCLHADPTPYDGWHVHTIELARQGTPADRDGTSFQCDGAQGFLHNHPRTGLQWCRLSRTDRTTLDGYAFAVLWCPTRRFTYEVRTPPVHAVAGSGTGGP
jgi:hypothetical protein